MFPYLDSKMSRKFVVQDTRFGELRIRRPRDIRDLKDQSVFITWGGPEEFVIVHI